MAVSISSLTTNTNDGTSATISVTTSESPTATQVGDLVVVIHGNNFYTLANMPTPTATGSPTLTNIVDADGGTNQGHIRAWWYKANTGGAQTVSVTETGAHDEEKDLAVFVFTGADTTSPIDGAASNFSTTDAQPVCPSISPANTDSYLIAPVQSGGAAGPAGYTPPGSLTEKYDVTVGQLEAAAGIAQLSSSGATGTFTWTNGVNRPYASATFAIKTASASASVAAAAEVLPPWLIYRLALRAQIPIEGTPPEILGGPAPVVAVTPTRLAVPPPIVTMTRTAPDPPIPTPVVATAPNRRATSQPIVFRPWVEDASPRPALVSTPSPVVRRGFVLTTAVAPQTEIRPVPLVVAAQQPHPAGVSIVSVSQADPPVVAGANLPIAYVIASPRAYGTAMVLARRSLPVTVAGVSADGRIVTTSTAGRMATTDTAGRTSSNSDGERITTTDASSRTASGPQGGRL